MRPPSLSLGILVYLIMRRWSPAAGSLAAASTLVVMAFVSVLALCPWPRWGPMLDSNGCLVAEVRRSGGSDDDRRGNPAANAASAGQPPVCPERARPGPRRGNGTRCCRRSFRRWIAS